MTTYKSSSTIQHTETLHTLPVQGNVLAYKLVLLQTLLEQTGRKKKLSSPSSRQGLTTKSNVSKYRSGKPGLESGLSLVTDATLEGMRRRGWSYEPPDGERYAWTIEKPYDHIESGGTGNLVRFKQDAHMLYDASNKVLPVGMYFEYISAYMDNRSYDLKRAVEILKDNPNVDLETARWSDEYIDDIPHYNSESNRNRCISFWWAPTQKEYQQMWKKCKEIGSKYPSTNRYQAVFELDLLGLRAGGAAKHETFYAPD